MASVAKPMHSPLETLRGNSWIIAKRSSECQTPRSGSGRNMRGRTLLVMLCVPWVLGAGVSSAFQDTLGRARAAFQRAQSAYLAKQYEAYRQSLTKPASLRPTQPPYLY